MDIGVLGTGSIGKRHMRNIQTGQYGDIACFDPSPKTLEEVNQLFPQVKSFDNEEELFSTINPQVLFICSPPQHHIPQLRKAIENDCHVFIEKPFCLHIDDAKEILELADSKRLKVMTGFNMRYVSQLITLKEWLKDGKIGQLLTCKVNISSYMPNWHPWEDYRQGFMAFNRSGGGALFDCVHGIDMAQWFAGKIMKLSAIQNTLSLEMETDDAVAIIGETETGAAINLYFDFLDRSNRRIIELIGTEGTAIWDLQTEHSLRLYHSQQHQNTFSTDKFDWDSCYQLEIAEFFGAIANDELIESDGWNGLDTQYVLEMAMTSNKFRTESSR